jgi:hypothetical protein
MFGGRTNKAVLPAPLAESLSRRFTPEFLTKLDTSTPITLYGEGYGPKIQGGEKYGDMPDFVLFDVKIGDWWLEPANMRKFALDLDIPVVPVVDYGTLYDACTIVQRELLSRWGNFEAEGVVARPVVQLFDRKGERIIAKIKARDFRD